MQRKSETYVLLLIALCLLNACSSDSVRDEKFEAPTLDFPLLGDIPTRPKLPDPCILAKQQQSLQSDHDQAIVKEAEVIKSMREKEGSRS
jgi:hypothetical protein